MPAEIANIRYGEVLVQTMVFPDHVAAIALYDPEEDADSVVVVSCGARDTYSDIFLFPTPDNFIRQADPGKLMEHCDEESYLTQIEDGEAFYIESGSRAGNMIEFMIRHTLMMSTN